ncbi:zinc ribbon domain-containing protein [bacterium]|nr:zinc ribbon domain-containing protein [bacterium]
MPAELENNQSDQALRQLAAAVLAQREYSLLLTLLRQQAAAGELAEADFAVLLYRLVAEDLAGDRWTYAPASGSWFKVTEDEWAEGEPRGPLLVVLPTGCAELLSGLTARLGAIEAEVRAQHYQASHSGVTAPAAQAPAFCQRCGSRLSATLKFCTQCGAAAKPPAAQPCPRCGTPVDPGTAYCGACGMHLRD